MTNDERLSFCPHCQRDTMQETSVNPITKREVTLCHNCGYTLDVKTNLVICPKWKECNCNLITKHNNPHEHKESCNHETNYCPACVPYKDESKPISLSQFLDISET